MTILNTAKEEKVKKNLAENELLPMVNVFCQQITVHGYVTSSSSHVGWKKSHHQPIAFLSATQVVIELN